MNLSVVYLYLFLFSVFWRLPYSEHVNMLSSFDEEKIFWISRCAWRILNAVRLKNTIFTVNIMPIGMKKNKNFDILSSEMKEIGEKIDLKFWITISSYDGIPLIKQVWSPNPGLK